MNKTINNTPRSIEWVRDGDCIRCTSHVGDTSGYPQTRRNGKKERISRRILVRRFGNLPSSIVTRHTCDHKWCINPRHLIHGTVADNNRDMMERIRNKPKASKT